MPSYKNKERNTWFCAFYYTDWQGKHKKKKKEGFATKREAQEWERKFLEQYADTPDLLFESLVEAYREYSKNIVKESTYKNRGVMIRIHILPFFADMPVNKITRRTVSEWRKEMNQKHIAAGYYRTIFQQLSTIFNFAVQYYNLPSNPCKNTGKLPQPDKKIQYYTLDEFRAFVAGVERPEYIMLYYILFWSGMRIGEALALSWSNIDFSKSEMYIERTMARVKGKDLITQPKTQSSIRTVSLPPFIMSMLHDYKRMTKYGSEFVFEMRYPTLVKYTRRKMKSQNMKIISIHGFRHSHASMLINAGFSPVDVANRLGHSNAAMTLRVYSHFYDSKRSQMSERLNMIN